MSDLISRQAAISTICNACGKIDCDKMDKCEKLQLPPANCSEFPNNSDTISRQAAIDALAKFVPYAICDESTESYTNGLTDAYNLILQLPSAQPVQCEDAVSRKTILKFLDDWMSALEDNVHNQSASDLKIIKKDFENLPSAEPQIIRCKDCKHWIPYDWMFSEVWRSKNMADYPEDEIGCNWCDMAMKADDFCSRAERREVTT